MDFYFGIDLLQQLRQYYEGRLSLALAKICSSVCRHINSGNTEIMDMSFLSVLTRHSSSLKSQ